MTQTAPSMCSISSKAIAPSWKARPALFRRSRFITAKHSSSLPASGPTPSGPHIRSQQPLATLKAYVTGDAAIMLDPALDPALDVSLSDRDLSFRYGPGVTGPDPSSARSTQSAAACSTRIAPAPIPSTASPWTSLALRTSKDLKQRMLLYGIVAYAAGRLGQEPTRSQGHVHAIAPHSGWSPPEVFRDSARPSHRLRAAIDRGRSRVVRRGHRRTRRKDRCAAGVGALRHQRGSIPRGWSSRRGATVSTASSTMACANTADWPGFPCSMSATHPLARQTHLSSVGADLPRPREAIRSSSSIPASACTNSSCNSRIR